MANGVVPCVCTLCILNIAVTSRGHAYIGNVYVMRIKVRSVVRCTRAMAVFSLIRRHVLSGFVCRIYDEAELANSRSEHAPYAGGQRHRQRAPETDAHGADHGRCPTSTGRNCAQSNQAH